MHILHFIFKTNKQTNKKSLLILRLFWPHLLEGRCCSHLAPEKEFQTQQGCQVQTLL